MTINVKLRSALALAVVAFAVTSLEIRSANAEHVTPARLSRVSTAAEQVKKLRVNIGMERKILAVAERKILERVGRVLSIDERKGSIGRDVLMRNSKRDILPRDAKFEKLRESARLSHARLLAKPQVLDVINEQ